MDRQATIEKPGVTETVVGDGLVPPVVEVRGLRYAYPGSATPAIDDMTFAVRPGEIFGFLGPSGAGKSTTQKVLNRLLDGYQGEVRVLQRDLRAWGPDYFEHIGVSFELPNHYQKLSGLENLEFFASLYSSSRCRDPRELLERVGLAEAAGKRVSKYSKGMQMRLTFARALLNSPDLLFLDEPTSGLDPVNASHVKSLIREERAAGRTIFLTTHDMSVANELCDRVAFVVDGRIALVDSPRQLAMEHGRRLVRLEYREGDELVRREFPLDGLGQDEEFTAILESRSLETVHTAEATLQEIFIKVTGRSLEQ